MIGIEFKGIVLSFDYIVRKASSSGRCGDIGSALSRTRVVRKEIKEQAIKT
jgi:hypothetical protein